MKSSKQSEGWVTNLWNKFSTDVFFRTTCYIILLQIVLTTILATGLWFVMEYLVEDTSQTLISTFAQMLDGGNVSVERVNKTLTDIKIDKFWSIVIMASAVIISFGFIMVYVALTPTRLSLERKKRFISNISHEIRTPLAIMRTNTDVSLLDKQISPSVRKRLERNLVEFDRITDIMNNLLGLSNLMQNQHLHFDEVDLNKVARRAMDSLAETIDHKDITMSIKSHTEQKVLGNGTALEQLIFNLLKNAITHIDSQGEVTVEIEIAADGKYIALSVSDTGSGIARNDLFHIFEPFYRARKPKGSGQGLGLAIVNEIVQMHRGKIRIKSALGHGTVVSVFIKRSEQAGSLAESEKKDGMEEVSMDFSHRLLQ